MTVPNEVVESNEVLGGVILKAEEGESIPDLGVRVLGWETGGDVFVDDGNVRLLTRGRGE